MDSVKAKVSRKKLFYNDDSSDSDTDFLALKNPGPSLHELRSRKSQLKASLQPNQELTGIQILRSDVNIIDTPVSKDYSPKTEEGIWKKVMVDCIVDVVWCVITFYIHEPAHVRRVKTFRGVAVNVMKEELSRELSASVLKSVRSPYNIVEVLRSYSAAHRSRRATLAVIAEKYKEAVHIELLPNGGYSIKVVDIFEIDWVLVNKRSHVAPFSHSLTLNFEREKELLVTRAEQLLELLSSPNTEHMTKINERTELLDMLISTSLEIKENIKSANIESVLGSKNTLEESARNMKASPKSLPKKTKPKGKENEPQNKKQPNSSNDDATKRARLDNGMAKKKNVKAAQNKKTSPNNVANTNKDNKIVANNNKMTKKAAKNETQDSKSVASINKDVNGKGVANKDKITNKKAEQNRNTNKDIYTTVKDNAKITNKNKVVEIEKTSPSKDRNVAIKNKNSNTRAVPKEKVLSCNSTKEYIKKEINKNNKPKDVVTGKNKKLVSKIKKI